MIEIQQNQLIEKTKPLLYTPPMIEVKTEIPQPGTGVALGGSQATHRGDFSLAHLSDLHLTSLDGAKISQLLNKRMLGYFSWLRKRRIVHRREIIDALLADLRITCPDQIAVTGDMTHLGLPMEYAEVKQWLPSLGGPEQVTVIPGNHDAYSGENWVNSCASWSQYLDSDPHRDSPKTAGFFPSLRIRGPVALIGLCSARPSPPFLATGSLGKQQLSALAEILRETRNKNLLRVVLIHHPPAPGVVNWRKCLTDSRLFAEVLKQYGAELVLHGHAHVPAFSEIPTPAGLVPVIGAPSSSELSPWTGNCAKYNIYRLCRTGSNWDLRMSVRGYSANLGRFVLEQERTLHIP